MLRTNLIQMSCPFQTMPNTDMTSHSFVLNASSALLAKRPVSVVADKKRKHEATDSLVSSGQPERMYKLAARTRRMIQASSWGSLSSAGSSSGDSMARRNRRTRQPRKGAKSRSRTEQYVEFKLLPNKLVLPVSHEQTSGQYQLQLVNKNKPLPKDQSVQRSANNNNAKKRTARLKSCEAASNLNKLPASRSNAVVVSSRAKKCLFIKQKQTTVHKAASIIIVSVRK